MSEQSPHPDSILHAQTPEQVLAMGNSAVQHVVADEQFSATPPSETDSTPTPPLEQTRLSIHTFLDAMEAIDAEDAAKEYMIGDFLDGTIGDTLDDGEHTSAELGGIVEALARASSMTKVSYASYITRANVSALKELYEDDNKFLGYLLEGHINALRSNSEIGATQEYIATTALENNLALDLAAKRYCP